MFFGKPLRLNFAKNDSDFNAKLKDTFDGGILKKRKANNQEFAKIRDLKARRKIIDKVIQLRRQSQQSHIGGDTTHGPGMAGRSMGQGHGLFTGQPEKYKILFVERLPKNITLEKLEATFGAYTGLVEVRQIAEKGFAFIEYLSDDCAAFALQDVKASNKLSFEDPDRGMKVEAKINFGKR